MARSGGEVRSGMSTRGYQTEQPSVLAARSERCWSSPDNQEAKQTQAQHLQEARGHSRYLDDLKKKKKAIVQVKAVQDIRISVGHPASIPKLTHAIVIKVLFPGR